MLEELQCLNYAETTIEAYIRAVKEFSQHFNCSPDRLGPQHIREYQAALFQKRKFSPNTVAQHLAALRFFYIKTLKKAWSIAETPYPKRGIHLPTILSKDEVARLIDAARPPLHRTLLMTLYATGLRRAELAHLKVSDVDSERMVIHVQGGKGRRDRDVLLSPKLLDEIKRHCCRLRAYGPEGQNRSCSQDLSGTGEKKRHPKRIIWELFPPFPGTLTEGAILDRWGKPEVKSDLASTFFGFLTH